MASAVMPSWRARASSVVFEREADAGAGDAAIGQDGRLVGAGGEGAAAEAGQHVGTGKDGADLRGLEAGAERVGGVGAGIDHRVDVDAEQLAVRGGPGGHVVMVFAAVGVGGKLLVPVLDPADGTVEADGEGGADEFFRQQDALVAEAAADVGRDDADLALVEAEAFGEAGLGDVRHLGGGGDDQLLEPGVPFGQHAAAFEGGHALAGRAQAAGDAGGGDGVEAGEVVVAGGFEEGVVGPVLVDAGGAGCAGRAACR